MAYESVKNQIDAYIRTNGVQLITGPILNAVLTAMLDNLGEGYSFRGVLPASGAPQVADDIPSAWIAGPGNYTDIGVVSDGQLALVTHTPDGWSITNIFTMSDYLRTVDGIDVVGTGNITTKGVVRLTEQSSDEEIIEAVFGSKSAILESGGLIYTPIFGKPDGQIVFGCYNAVGVFYFAMYSHNEQLWSYKSLRLATNERLMEKQDKLVSGKNIKTINGESVLGNGDIKVKGGADPSLDDPLMDGVASPGTSDEYARGDHRHPSDTSKANVVRPSFEDSVYVGPPSSALSGSSSLRVDGRHIDGDFVTIEHISLYFNYATDWSPNVSTSRGELRFNARDTDVAVIAKGGTVAMLSDIPANVEQTTNKVTSLSAESTDTQYPSAKCVYDIVGNIETLLSAL